MFCRLRRALLPSPNDAGDQPDLGLVSNRTLDLAPLGCRLGVGSDFVVDRLRVYVFRFGISLRRHHRRGILRKVAVPNAQTHKKSYHESRRQDDHRID